MEIRIKSLIKNNLKIKVRSSDSYISGSKKKVFIICMLLLSLFPLILTCSNNEKGWTKILADPVSGGIYYSKIVDESGLLAIGMNDYQNYQGIYLALIDTSFSFSKLQIADSLQINSSKQVEVVNDSLIFIAALKEDLVRSTELAIKKNPVTAAMDKESRQRLLGDSLFKNYSKNTHLLLFDQNFIRKQTKILNSYIPEVICKDSGNNVCLLCDSAAIIDSTEDKFLTGKYHYEYEHSAIISVYDNSLNLLKRKIFPGESASSLIAVQNGSALVTKIKGKNNNSFLLMRGFNKENELTWIKKHNFTGFNPKNMVHFNNKFWLAGTAENEIRVLQFDNYGDYIKVLTFAGAGEEGIGSLATDDNNLFIAGTIQTYTGEKSASPSSSILLPVFSHKLFCLKINKRGEIVWRTEKNVTGISQINSLTFTPYDNILLGGYVFDNKNSLRNKIILKLLSNGNLD